MSAPPGIKICCIQDVDEAEAAIAAGAGAIGLVSAMPSGPGPIAEGTIAQIVAAVAGRVETFLLTCRREVDAIVAQVRRCRPSVVQLVDAVPPAVRRAVRDACPGLKLVQVIHVRDGTSVAEAVATVTAGGVDALLLDSGRPDAAVPELGGTGRVHDWALSRRIRERVSVPVYLAGGLRPENVAAAIAAVEPAAVDVCSGVRRDGLLDESRLRAFTAAVRAAGRDAGR